MIEEAVMRAGMVRPPDEGTGSVDSHSTDGSETLRSTASDSSKKALFKGTYGQVKQALKEAGLVAVSCPEEGVEHGTKIGALFVANSGRNASGDLELTKLTLWG